jgi:hypothetical protein
MKIVRSLLGILAGLVVGGVEAISGLVYPMSSGIDPNDSGR